MSMYLDPPLSAKNGHCLEVLIAGRVSDPGPGKQDIRSLDDQEAMHLDWLRGHTELEFNPTVIAGSGSGEWLEREEYLRLLEEVETNKYDLVLTEDLGRIVRRIHAHLFCEHCVDHDTRLISLNDNVDTARPGWQDASIFSAWHHERSNRDTSDRIKRTHRSRFDNGGCAACEIFCYIKPEGAQSDADWMKNEEYEEILKEWFRMLDEDEATYSEIADWLNSKNIPTGKYCLKEKWDGRMVGRVTHNWMLKGVRFRNKQKTRRNSKGKYVSIKADPAELRTRSVPHLAFFEPEYYDRVVAQADERNSIYRRKGENGRDTRCRVPKKSTRFPGQIIVCGVCGYGYVFGGHGQKDHLMCDGARNYNCWNGLTVEGPLAAKNISMAVFQAIEAMPDFDPAFMQVLEIESNRLSQSRQDALRELEQKIRTYNIKITNGMNFVLSGDTSQRVRDELTRLEKELRFVQYEHQQLLARTSGAIELPSSEEVRLLARESVEGLALESKEFAKVMRQIIPKIVVFPYRLCDGGHIELRASFRLCLGRLLKDPRLSEVFEEPLQQIVTVDLFVPPQREMFRKELIELRKINTEKAAAEQLGITITAAQRSAALQRKMDELGIVDPYLPVLEPPSDYTKLTRHKHERYQFKPLPDAGSF